VQDAVGPGENDVIDIGPITLSRWLRMYRISQTRGNPRLADQPNAVYTAYWADYRYRGDG